MNIQLKRIYDPASEEDGYRVLVDGMWPRGVAKRNAALDEWCRELAPSKSLRQWFGHDRARWDEFHRAYRAELREGDGETLARLREHARRDGLTLLFAARDVEYNNARVLKDHLEDDA
ncbi:DUF488 family protein [Halomonas sp. HP20-15]|uniref:DUF488 domain-containing protein n=1 Tax=Halomonas sp. HP20-15 TaxID=3085901 RepID=UPI0029816FCF|nr:DUF488 family protein [Halomonas sp. HP20-15]MDW5375774.1 DUF488 family protein [Halomonas sp. HP20-15]